jgi:nucleoside-diphosphate-sugar epimerase
MAQPTTVLAGATGDLGGRIASLLLERDASLRILARKGGRRDRIGAFQNRGAEVIEVDFNDAPALTEACLGGTCVVSALAGLREVVIDAQTLLLDAAVRAGVPRFIPSDFSIDFTKCPDGHNRNLDLRREFHRKLDRAPLAATSILNGGFMGLLTGQAPVILYRFHRVMYWENADQPLDFTTIDNTAEFTAAAALDPSTPRFLRIAGDQISARDLVDLASDVTGHRYRLLRGGSLRRLTFLIKVFRKLSPQETALYPPWQGMQYLHNMFSGCAKLEPLDNRRYPGMRWTTVKEFLAKNVSREGRRT